MNHKYTTRCWNYVKIASPTLFISFENGVKVFLGFLKYTHNLSETFR